MKCHFLIIILSLSALLSSCGGGSGGGLTCSPTPQITSIPPTTAMVGQQYSYVVNAAYVCGLFICGDYYPIQVPDGTVVSLSPKYLTWTPAIDQANTNVQFSIGTGPDTCGQSATQSWTVHVTPNNIPPLVNSVYPSKGNINVPPNTTISASFSEPIDPLSVGAVSFLVSDSSGSVPGNLQVSGNNVTFTPNSNLLSGTVTVTITTAVIDTAGNALATNYTWTFSVGVPPDLTPPSVPKGFTVMRSTASEVDLSWNASLDNVGVAGYNIYRDGVYINSVTNSGASWWASDVGLNFNTSYSYTVSAYDFSGNESGQSGPVGPLTLDFLPGNVTIWGYAYHSQDGSYWPRTIPDVAVDCSYSCFGLDNVSAISMGGDQSLAVKSDGTLWQWDFYDPVLLGTLSNVTSAAVGPIHMLAVKSDGSVWAWGNNAYGQLGDGATTDTSTPVQMLNLSQIGSVAAGLGHTLALKSDGTVWAAGGNWFGQLGDGTTSSQSTAIQIPTLSNIVAISASGSQSLALKSDGTIWAWGGTGPYTYSSTPIQVQGISNAIGMSQGQSFSLVVKLDGTVWAWGSNGSGQLGDGTNTDRVAPVQVTGITNVIQVAAGDNHSMALRTDGTVWAWGANDNGQLGDGTTVSKNVPVQVLRVTHANAIAAGARKSLALR